MAVVTFGAACTGCGACLLTCPTHAIRPDTSEHGPDQHVPQRSRAGLRRGGHGPDQPDGRLVARLTARDALCTGCGECVEICPVDAITLPGELPAPALPGGPNSPARRVLRRATTRTIRR